ncbi:hypothetical protein [Anaerobacillus sp. 1_MG-2023]|uniref:hypothetical protein n=1 Tax=Anaerobacillus sp. 1_MG-2023 TaxID=3062655 RepID=UPI0026E44617|nr:hypothetical protein [Anaerobacillus sp. 1_MG-2023]MDO6658641.1 hypothetical protein [Anaerobacillus sp. 1_MG-2023]
MKRKPITIVIGLIFTIILVVWAEAQPVDTPKNDDYSTYNRASVSQYYRSIYK